MLSPSGVQVSTGRCPRTGHLVLQRKRADCGTASCATAFGVRYASQQVSRKDRKYLQSQRLRRFLGKYPNSTTIHKPLFMRRKTYNALLKKLRHIEVNSDGRKYKSKRLTERTLKPTNMYQVEVAHIANVF